MYQWRGGSPLKESTAFHDLNRTMDGGGNPQGIILYAAWQLSWVLSNCVFHLRKEQSRSLQIANSVGETRFVTFSSSWWSEPPREQHYNKENVQLIKEADYSEES